MKLVDVPDSKSGGLLARVGSSPTAGKEYKRLMETRGFGRVVSRRTAYIELKNAPVAASVLLPGNGYMFGQ